MLVLFSQCKFDTLSHLKTLFFFTSQFFFTSHFFTSQIDLLKAIDAANFDEVSNVKLYILQIKSQRNNGCNTYFKKLTLALVFVLICLILFSLLFFFFSVCAFIMTLLVDCSLQSLALFEAICFFNRLECNLYYLVKRKRAEHISKYLKV